MFLKVGATTATTYIFYVHLPRFVVWANIAAACEGVRRRVGELNGGSQVVRAFSHLHKEFFK